MAETIVIDEIIKGRHYRHHFTSIFDSQKLAASYFQARKDITQHGIDGAMQLWHDVEAVERRDLELEVKDRY